jgi:hypothetical protein
MKLKSGREIVEIQRTGYVEVLPTEGNPRPAAVRAGNRRGASLEAAMSNHSPTDFTWADGWRVFALVVALLLTCIWW